MFTEATAFPYLSEERRSHPSVGFQLSAHRWFCRIASELGLHLQDRRAVSAVLLASVHSATGKQRNQNQQSQKKKKATETSQACQLQVKQTKKEGTLINDCIIAPGEGMQLYP